MNRLAKYKYIYIKIPSNNDRILLKICIFYEVENEYHVMTKMNY